MFSKPAASRAVDCIKVQRRKIPAPAPITRAAAPAKLVRINVGKFGFGPALQSSLLLVDPITEEESIKKFGNAEAKDKYQVVLEPRIPAGAYVAVSDGTPDVDGFSEVLSMPEDVRHLRLNGYDFGDPRIEFDPKKPLDFYWRAPAITNDQNGLIMQVIHGQTDTIYGVACDMSEADVLTTSGYKNFSLNPTWFSEFPTTGQVSVYFIRAHHRRPENKRSRIDIQGMRTFYAYLDVVSP
jgi:hypothetical protein